MAIWQCIVNQLCFSQDGVSVSWAFVAAIFAGLWIKRVCVSKKTD